MALNASMNWWVRAGGDASNGGGFDAAVAGAGTNYADQDAAQVVFSAGNANRLSTSGAGATTVTSAGTPFTSAMVGNVIRISGGTNFQTGYYTVVTYTDASNVVLDRTPTSGGAGADGVGSLGGAFATPWGSLSTGGTGFTAPPVTSPLAAGHTVNLRGGGTDTPATADYTLSGYAQYPSGSTGAGRIQWLGYNGRPRFDCTEISFHVSYHTFRHLFFVMTSAINATWGLIYSSSGGHMAVIDVRVDQAGYDKLAFGGVAHVLNCEFVNSGSTAAGTLPALKDNFPALSYTSNWIGNKVDGWRGGGMRAGYGVGAIRGNLIVNTKAVGIEISTTSDYAGNVSGNSVYGNTGDGIKISSAWPVLSHAVVNNILDSNGGYGINVSVGSVALNDRLKTLIDYNAFRNNTSGAVNGISAGDNDITLSADPFTNAAGGDFTLNNTAGGGADLKNVAFPTSIP